MTLAQAGALCRAHKVPFDAAKSRQALELLAKWCLRFSPVVAIDPTPSGYHLDDFPDGLLLDVTGEAHLFGNEHLLLTEISTRLRRMGFESRMAIAPTPGAAWALAHFGPHALAVMQEKQVLSALSPLPTASLRLASVLWGALKEVGIEQVGHLLALPRESLLARYGTQLLTRLDQALGRANELIHPLHPTEPLSLCRLFDGAALQIEAILLTVRDMIAELSNSLLERESGIRGLRLKLLRIHAPPVTHELILGRPTRDEKHLWGLLHAKVEGMNLGYGVEALRMTAFWTQAIPHHQLGTWGLGEANADEEAFDALVDTLINRWGTNRVLSACVIASHTPEVARQFRPARDHAPAGELAFVDRPSILFDRPEPAEAIALQPDRPPSYLRWRGEGYDVRSGQGPERIVTAWWQTQRPSTRDYFKAQVAGGLWLWAFRELESGRWFIQGLWA